MLGFNRRIGATPMEIRPSEVQNREIFLLWVEAEPERQLPQEFFYAIVEHLNPKTILFVAADPS